MKTKIIAMTEQEKEMRLSRFLNAPDKQLFLQEDVAIYLSCSEQTLQRLRCNGGGIPYTKIGRTVTYKKADVLHIRKNKQLKIQRNLLLNRSS